MRGIKKLCSLFFIILLTMTVTAQADVFTPKVSRHGGAYISLEGFNAEGNDTFISNQPFGVVMIAHTAAPDFTADNRNLNFNTDTDWGYRIAVGYDYRSCCPCNYGFSLEYMHYHTNEYDSFTLEPRTSLETTRVVVPIDANLPVFFSRDFTAVNARFSSKYDTVDLLAHHNRVLCQCVDAQFFLGARYLNLKQDWHSQFTETVSPVLINTTNEELLLNFKNRFHGIGPRVGIAGFYPFYCNFGVSAEVAGNLLFGCTNSEFTEHFTGQDLLTGSTEVSSFRDEGRDRAKFVPAWSGKVALAYHADFCNCSGLTVEVGYRGDKYYEISDVRAWVQAIPGDSAQIKNGLYHDYEITGPYLSVSYHM